MQKKNHKHCTYLAHTVWKSMEPHDKSWPQAVIEGQKIVDTLTSLTRLVSCLR